MMVDTEKAIEIRVLVGQALTYPDNERYPGLYIHAITAAELHFLSKRNFVTDT